MTKRVSTRNVLVLLTATSATAYLASFRCGHGSALCSTRSAPGPLDMAHSVGTRDSKILSSAPFRNDTDVFWSYYYNLQRVKRLKSPSRDTLMKPAKSLLHYLQIHARPSSFFLQDAELDQALTRASIQAIRVACSVNDYRFVLNLLSQTAENYNRGRPVSNRILGEAIRNLRQTSASINKIKKIWALVDAATVTAQEVNAMLEALSSHHKVQAALDLFRVHLAAQQVDQYSVGIILQALTNSIQDQQRPNYDITSSRIKHKQLRTMIGSPCWQWKEAVQLLDECLSSSSSSSNITFNNPIFSNLIRLDERACQVFAREHRSHALSCLELMRYFHLAPDQVTCTHLLGASHSWRSSLQLFRQMQQQNDEDDARSGDASWRLPRPNVYCYSAVISACARAQQYEIVMSLSEELRRDPLVEANTYTYNGVLQALVAMHGRKRHSKERLLTALEMLHLMQQDESSRAPDTVTFNTILAICASVRLQDDDWKSLAKLGHVVRDAESLVHELLDRMSELQLKQDLVTFRHAIQAVGASGLESIERTLSRALDYGEWGSPEQYTDLMNAALAALSISGNAEGSFNCIARMTGSRLGAKPDMETMTQLIDCLGQGGNARSIPLLLRALDGYEDAKNWLNLKYGNLAFDTLPLLSDELFARAIRACLLNEDFVSCRDVLNHMQLKGVVTSPLVMQEVAKAYALASIKRSRHSSAFSTPIQEDVHSHAVKASVIVDGLEQIPVSLLSLTTRACAEAGMFAEARRYLRLLHESLMLRFQRSHEPHFSRVLVEQNRLKEDNVLPALHRQLMKSCANRGNVTAALLFCEDIQGLSHALTKKLEQKDKHDWLSQATSSLYIEGLNSTLSMHLPEWTFLLEAACKSGHWKVCLSTLQFIRPYMEGIHVSRRLSPVQLQREYRHVSRALTTAVSCLTIRSQYAWAVRSIEDSILWSGRRPPIAAVLACVRALSLRGRDKEVIRLVATCLQAPPVSMVGDRSYEMTLYVSAITAVSNEGLYAAADELFLAAITRGIMGFTLNAAVVDDQPCVTIDLHRMNLAVARSAVRIALQKHMSEIASSKALSTDIVIITGRGLGSAFKMRPVLRPEVSRLLQEEFYPPLNTYSVPGNMGALRIPYTDVQAWVDHQNSAKGAHMLTVASALKRLASVKRLRDVFVFNGN